MLLRFHPSIIAASAIRSSTLQLGLQQQQQEEDYYSSSDDVIISRMLLLMIRRPADYCPQTVRG